MYQDVRTTTNTTETKQFYRISDACKQKLEIVLFQFCFNFISVVWAALSPVHTDNYGRRKRSL